MGARRQASHLCLGSDRITPALGDRSRYGSGAAVDTGRRGTVARVVTSDRAALTTQTAGVTMRLALPMTIGLAVVIAAAACGGKPAAPPPAPAPQPNQDSIEASRRQQAMRDSIAREQARRDSAARAQAESDRIRRQRESDSLQALGREGDAVKAMIARQ